MKSLVEDLLFLAKSDDSANKETLSDVNLSDVVQGSILSFASLAFESGITLNDTVQPDITMTGNEPKLRRLCGILLDNALKYVNAHGSVNVDLRTENGNALLRVQNTGAPIPAEELPHLFERFYRVDRARSAGGYGLGLSIAQSIVKAHGGKISVTDFEWFMVHSLLKSTILEKSSASDSRESSSITQDASLIDIRSRS